LEATKRRVDAMAFVHEEIYTEPRMDGVRLGAFLSRFAGEIQQAEGGLGRRRIEVDAHDIRLDIQCAVAIGIITAEVVANACRHAFVGRSGGSIWVHARAEEGRTTIEVIDDGVGIPPGLEAGPGLGLTLVRSLASQLNATVLLERRETGGTRFALSVPARSGFAGQRAC
ncbi:MAG TPA: sensor histidine kinase, partial [Rectinemataceae bacterium]|nr:sensor histidine kinase [Rectinemataceae bacterium]